jgi:hypothetical protein
LGTAGERALRRWAVAFGERLLAAAGEARTHDPRHPNPRAQARRRRWFSRVRHDAELAGRRAMEELAASGDPVLAWLGRKLLA